MHGSASSPHCVPSTGRRVAAPGAQRTPPPHAAGAPATRTRPAAWAPLTGAAGGQGAHFHLAHRPALVFIHHQQLLQGGREAAAAREPLSNKVRVAAHGLAPCNMPKEGKQTDGARHSIPPVPPAAASPANRIVWTQANLDQHDAKNGGAVAWRVHRDAAVPCGVIAAQQLGCD